MLYYAMCLSYPGMRKWKRIFFVKAEAQQLKSYRFRFIEKFLI